MTRAEYEKLKDFPKDSRGENVNKQYCNEESGCEFCDF